MTVFALTHLFALFFGVFLAQAAPAQAVAENQSMRVSVLPLTAEAGDEAAARGMEALLAQVLKGMPGVALLSLDTVEPARAAKVRALLERCGDQTDCRLRMGNILGAQVLIFGKAASAGADCSLVDLEFLDVGSACAIRKISRSLMGSPEQQRRSLDASLTEVLFPERLVGCIELDIQPAGAQVFLDGRLQIAKAKRSERLERLPATSHTLRVSLAGHADFYAIVSVPYRDTNRLVVRLRPASGKTLGNEPAADPWVIKPEDAWYEHWWVWVVVGAVVAGGVTAGVVLGR